MRREALDFFTDLVRSLHGDAKDRVLERLDLIATALFMLNHDTSTIAIEQTLALLESCFYYEAENLPKKLRKWENDGEEIGQNTDWALQLQPRWLIRFFACDGENILISLRERYAHNPIIYEVVTNFEFRYFLLDLDQIEAFQQETIEKLRRMNE